MDLSNWITLSVTVVGWIIISFKVSILVGKYKQIIDSLPCVRDTTSYANEKHEYANKAMANEGAIKILEREMEAHCIHCREDMGEVHNKINRHLSGEDGKHK